MNEIIEDLSNTSNKKVMKLLKEEIYKILKMGDLDYKIIIAYFNEILKEIEKRLKNNGK